MNELPKTDSGSEFIQFRGRQASVVLDEFGIRFTDMVKETPDGEPNIRMHEPLPVADAEAIRAGEAESNAVARPVAEQITNGDLANPLINWGVMCEYPTEDGVCGDVFDTPKSLNGHLSHHYDGEPEPENQRDVNSSASDEDNPDEDGSEEGDQ